LMSELSSLLRLSKEEVEVSLKCSIPPPKHCSCFSVAAYVSDEGL
jgi:hypothetical protein